MDVAQSNIDLAAIDRLIKTAAQTVPILVACFVAAFLLPPLARLFFPNVPTIHVQIEEDETAPQLDKPLYRAAKHDKDGSIACVDPATGQLLGHVREFTPEDVAACIASAEVAQKEWAKSRFGQRKRLLRIFTKHMLEHAESICRVAVRDSGKPMVDAAFGELVVTCEKALWLVDHGEQYLKPERRRPGRMMFYKAARVDYVPVGVVGTIVPWNYPFHNIFNPLLAAVFAGNSIVVKVSEHASWSARYYQAIADAALAAAGAPSGLIQVITGRADTGRALVRGGCGKLIFIGSTDVGRAVMRDAADTLTPVTLELGGKDPFVVCDDVSVAEVLPTALRAAFQSCGQNCVAAERFIVQAGVYDEFVARCGAAAAAMRQGNPLGGETVDCGAMCLPGLAERVHSLVQDAAAAGARIMAGGALPEPGATSGQFYPPTVVADVTPAMRLFREEAFGPVMTICRATDDADAVRLANDCAFGLGAYCFSRSQARAARLGAQLESGMFVVNDYASNAMCQSLPFGGVKESGFGRFGGIEGLRGMCIPRVTLLDRAPWIMRTAIPPPLQYPVAPYSFDFVHALCKMFYGTSVGMKVSGLLTLARLSIAPPKAKLKAA